MAVTQRPNECTGGPGDPEGSPGPPVHSFLVGRIIITFKVEQNKTFSQITKHFANFTKNETFLTGGSVIFGEATLTDSTASGRTFFACVFVSKKEKISVGNQ